MHEEPPESSQCDETISLKKGDEEVLISEEEAKRHETPVSKDKIHEWLGRIESSKSEAEDLHEDLVLPPPPPYPNGWFYLCHSNAVGRNQGWLGVGLLHRIRFLSTLMLVYLWIRAKVYKSLGITSSCFQRREWYRPCP